MARARYAITLHMRSVGAMKRREFLRLAAVISIRPMWAKAEQAIRAPVVGVLWHAGSAEEEKDFSTPLRAGFADLGYVEGKNIRFEERYPAEKKELFDHLAAE